MLDQDKDQAATAELSRFAEELRPHAGEIALLYGTDLVRLHGVASDASDFYYIVQKRSSEPYWASAVGHIDWLYGRLDNDAYQRLEEGFTQSGVTVRDFLVQEQRFPRILDLEGETAPREPFPERVAAIFERQIEIIAPGSHPSCQAWRLASEIYMLRHAGIDEAGRDAVAAHIEAGRALARRKPGQLERHVGTLSAALFEREHRSREMGCGIATEIQEAIRALAGSIPRADECWADYRANARRRLGGPESDSSSIESYLHILNVDAFPMPVIEPKRADTVVIRAIEKHVPAMIYFLRAWLEEYPALVDLWRGRLEQGELIPFTALAQAFLVANFPDFRTSPVRIGMSFPMLASTLKDIKACAIPLDL
ncbi:hypothetical protein ACEUZ9_001061 [Paracoccus litorisediminis]|uniref:hypothetical protein n=1 Tax=Paracoccus litorisediminis TaxID=2006130 RepID=UPI0037346B34